MPSPQLVLHSSGAQNTPLRCVLWDLSPCVSQPRPHSWFCLLDGSGCSLNSILSAIEYTAAAAPRGERAVGYLGMLPAISSEVRSTLGGELP